MSKYVLQIPACGRRKNPTAEIMRCLGCGHMEAPSAKKAKPKAFPWKHSRPIVNRVVTEDWERSAKLLSSASKKLRAKRVLVLRAIEVRQNGEVEKAARLAGAKTWVRYGLSGVPWTAEKCGLIDHVKRDSLVKDLKAEKARLTAVPLALRKQLTAEAEGTPCEDCGVELTRDKGNMQVDHRVPAAYWGKPIRENLRVICRDCNHKKRHAWPRGISWKESTALRYALPGEDAP